MTTNTLDNVRIKKDLRFDEQTNTVNPFNSWPYMALDRIAEFSGYQYYARDFNSPEDYTGPGTGATSGGWILTDTGTSVVAVAASVQFGELVVATGGTDNNDALLQMEGEPWRYVPGKRMGFMAKVRVSDANDAEIVLGLAITDTSPIASNPSDGLFFSASETATEWSFTAAKGAVEVTESAITGTFEDNTYRTVGFLVNTNGSVSIYDGLTPASLALAGTIQSGSLGLPDDQDLTLTIGVQTGNTGSESIKIDWISIFQERTITV